jgi:hypothetical protein
MRNKNPLKLNTIENSLVCAIYAFNQLPTKYKNIRLSDFILLVAFKDLQIKNGGIVHTSVIVQNLPFKKAGLFRFLDRVITAGYVDKIDNSLFCLSSRGLFALRSFARVALRSGEV